MATILLNHTIFQPNKIRSEKHCLDIISNTEFRYVCKAMDPYLYQSENIKGTTTFQLFGADVVFDNNMHPYLLEFNKGPDMTGRDKTDEKLKDNVIYDMYALVGIMPMSGSTQTFFKIHES